MTRKTTPKIAQAINTDTGKTYTVNARIWALLGALPGTTRKICEKIDRPYSSVSQELKELDWRYGLIEKRVVTAKCGRCRCKVHTWRRTTVVAVLDKYQGHNVREGRV